MNNPVNQMKEHLGLPLDFKEGFDNLYKVALRFEKLTGNDQNVTAFSLVFWLDEYGDFTTKKDACSKIVNEIFMGMGEEISTIIPFIELCQNNYIEEE